MIIVNSFEFIYAALINALRSLHTSIRKPQKSFTKCRKRTMNIRNNQVIHFHEHLLVSYQLLTY